MAVEQIAHSEASNVVSLKQSTEDEMAARAEAGLKLATRGGNDWIDGSLRAAEAFYQAREMFRADIAFSSWVTAHGFHLALSTHERAALVAFGSDLAQARTVFEKTKYRNYRGIWREAQRTWKHVGLATVAIPKPVRGRPKQTEKPQVSKITDAEVHRRVKLGEYYEAIKGTSLDTPREKDALIKLIDGQSNFAITHGGETPVVPALIKRAAAGESVSAISVCAEKKRAPPPTKDELIKAWMQSRVLAIWLRADKDVQDQFCLYLMEQRHG